MAKTNTNTANTEATEATEKVVYSPDPKTPFRYVLQTGFRARNTLNGSQRLALALNLKSAAAQGATLEDFVRAHYIDGDTQKPVELTGSDDENLPRIRRHFTTAWQGVAKAMKKAGVAAADIPAQPTLGSSSGAQTGGSAEVQLGDNLLAAFGVKATK